MSGTLALSTPCYQETFWRDKGRMVVELGMEVVDDRCQRAGRMIWDLLIDKRRLFFAKTGRCGYFGPRNDANRLQLDYVEHKTLMQT